MSFTHLSFFLLVFFFFRLMLNGYIVALSFDLWSPLSYFYPSSLAGEKSG